MNYENQKLIISDFLCGSEKSPEDYLIGAELEYFVVDKNSHRSISYYKDNGIKSILKKLVAEGFKPAFENENIIGVSNSDLAVTLEPGAQFEISLNPQKNLKAVEQKFLNFESILKPILEINNQKLFSAGYQPVTKIEDVKIIPKKRYDFMQNYLSKQGNMALNMMKGTASVQVAVDYSSEKDFAEKMRLASRLTPILSAVYDNSGIFEGKPYKNYCLRTKIWNNCDDARCGMIPQVFDADFGYEKYAEYLLDLVPIFIPADGYYLKCEKSFRECFDPPENTTEQLNHMFSMSFPDVRARDYIELRMTDSLPYPLNFAFLELVNELFYNNQVFEEISKMLKNISLNDVNSAKVDAVKFSTSAELGSRAIIDYFREIIDVIGDISSEHFYLNKELAESGILPRNMN
jgi:glutamate--cysteine ligase